MRTEPITSAKNNLSALLREVRAGRTIVITDRGVPVAELVPPRRPPKGITPKMIEAAQQGKLILPTREPNLRWLIDTPPPKRTPGAPSAVEMLIADREDRV